MTTLTTVGGTQVFVDDDIPSKIKVHSPKMELKLFGRRNRYVRFYSKLTGDYILLSRFVLDYSGPLVVGHLDDNPRNNQRSNLKLLSNGENMATAPRRSDNKSGVPGVAFDSRRQVWRSRIHVNNQELFLGYFDTFEAAVNARFDASNKYYGEIKTL